MRHRLRVAVRIAALLPFAAGWAAPLPARAQTLVIGSSAPVTSIDPHYHTLAPNESLADHIYDQLVLRDANGKTIPGLALSWRLKDEKTWEFKLRTTKFHNGADFTAEDVAYTLNRVPHVKNSPASFSVYTKAVTSTEIVDPHTILLHTAAPYPLLPLDLSQVGIIPHGLGPDPATEDFNSGKDAIGTGPYRFVSYTPGDRIELERNDDYWGPHPHWKHVTYRIITNDGARTAALLAGDVGMIEFVPTADVARLRKDPRVSLFEVVSNRSIFLWLDRSRQGPTPYVTGPNGETLTTNPLNDRRVRLALSLAINRQAIVDRVMEGTAIPTGQWLPPDNPTYAKDVPPPPFDPARAKALLAEAGYPNGLRVTIHGPNNRYVNDAKIIQAIGQMWQRIGVQTTVEALPWTAFITKAGKQDFSIYLLGWGVASGEGLGAMRPLVATWNPARGLGSANRGRYSNPALDALLDKAMSTMDDEDRETLVREATKMAEDDVAQIPLHQQKAIWATRKGLVYEPRVGEATLAMGVREQK